MPVLGDNLYGNKKANKKYAVKYQALFASRILFETGTHNSLEYLDKKQVELQDYQFPEVGLL